MYLNRVFADDPDFRQAADNWAVEEVQHGDALGRWAMLADPPRLRGGVRAFSGRLQAAAGRDKLRCAARAPAADRALHGGDRNVQLLQRTRRGTAEPVLRQICKNIAADEFRHYKLFYDHMRRYLTREKIGLVRRLRIALGRIGESEDDELAFAWHCGNQPESEKFARAACTAAYMGRAMRFYRFRHVERGMGMVFKAIGIKPRGRLSDVTAKLAWRLLRWRQRQFMRRLSYEPTNGKARARRG